MIRRHHSMVQRFDIELYGNSGQDDDVVLLTGPPLEAGSCSLKGRIVWCTLEHTNVKRINLQLVGRLQLSWADPGIHKVGPLPMRFEKQLYTQEYTKIRLPGTVDNRPDAPTSVSSNANLGQYFDERPASPKRAMTRSGSLGNVFSGLTPLKQPNSPKSPKPATNYATKPTKPVNSPSKPVISPLSSSSRAGLSKSNPSIALPRLANSSSKSTTDVKQLSPPSAPSRNVQPGTYTFPFELIIPGTVAESIEVNRYAKLNYTLHATLERAVLQDHLSAKKPISIVRTVGVDNYDVAHTVSIQNTWPGKIEYAIRIPCKAAPFGSQLEVEFAMMPLAKGLKLGRMRTEIVEYVTLKSPHTDSREEENVCGYQFFEVPANFDHMADEWQMTRMVKLPTSLSKCSQDADIDPYVKIQHKLRCFIGLVNSDGHTSELRASLPITLYISPNVKVTHPDLLGGRGVNKRASSASVASLAPAEKPLFRVVSSAALPASPSLQNLQDVAAPPKYSNHIYDPVYSNVSTPLGSPLNAADPISRPVSPLALSRTTSGTGFAKHTHEPSQGNIASGLRNLVLHRQKSNASISPRASPLSRASSHISIEALSRVPSYAEAINEQATADCAPGYTD